MTEKQEIKFWQKARKVILAGYGKPCKEFAWNCPACHAGLALAWIDDHIALLKWAGKYPQNKENNSYFKKS